MKSKLGILEDSMDLALDDKTYNTFGGRLSQLDLTSGEMDMIHSLHSFFEGKKGPELREIQNDLYYDEKLKELEPLFDEKKDAFTFKIEFQDVSFKYSAEADYVFKHLNYTFEPGQVCGIISASGLGKTTFLNLAIGLLKPTEGKILINGRDTNEPEFDLGTVFDHTAFVTQSTQLFTESILTNILLGNTNLLARASQLVTSGTVAKEQATRYIANKVLNSLWHAQAVDFISIQEKGLLTLLGDRVEYKVTSRVLVFLAANFSVQCSLERYSDLQVYYF